MTKLNKQMDLKELAGFVGQELEKAGIEVILTGGAVVSIYSKNKYQSYDLDFLSQSDHQKIIEAMYALGFKNVGKDFFHPDTKFYVEFPGTVLVIGDEYMKPEGEIKIGSFKLKLLSPTQCVMDRLAAFYYFKDRQALEQALLVAKAQPIKLKEVERWSIKEGQSEGFEKFKNRLKA